MLPLHLGERLNGIQEVSGSIPLISTIEALKTVGFQGFFRCAELFSETARKFFDPYLTAN